MTLRAQSSENLGRGAALALLAIPVGVVVLVLLQSIGFVAAIAGFIIAFTATTLYRRGSGGIISRAGAFIVLGIVAVSLLLGFFAGMAVAGAGGLGHLATLGDGGYWRLYFDALPRLFSASLLPFILTLAFGALGSFRTLSYAFRSSAARNSPQTIFGNPPPPTPAPPTYVAPSYNDPAFTGRAPVTGATPVNDVAPAPTGSADDKIPPAQS